MAKKSLPVVSFDDAIVNPDNQDANFKGAPCDGCAFQDPKHKRVLGGGAMAPVDLMFVSESPSSWSAHNQRLFYGRGGRIIKQTWDKLREQDKADGGHLGFSSVKTYGIYAIQCQVEEGRDQSATIPMSAIDRCSHYLHSAVLHRRPKIILTFGATALKSLGFRGEKFMDMRGRVLDIEIQGHKAKVIPTFSTKHVVAKTGLYNLFRNDFIRAARLASGVDQARAQVPIEELTRGYTIPRTVEEVKALCDEIVAYTGNAASFPPQNWTIAVDTETNTKHPHRKDAKVLCISLAWDEGKATAIPLWHKDAPWGEGNQEVIDAVRKVLECPKPKTLHNAKFDLKMLENRHGLRVVNVAWDTMLGEHLLREDQSGAYSLKILGRSYFPEFSSYADHVQELAEKLTIEEEGVQESVKGVRRQKIKKDTPGFEEGLVVEYGKADIQKYLFGSKRDRKKRTNDSGYERVPIDILLLYAAVDTDLTRRLIKHQFGRLHEERYSPKAKAIMSRLSLPGTRVLGRMEFRGMRVDRPYLEYLDQELSRVVATKEAEMLQYWDVRAATRPDDDVFNPNSTEHLSRVLYDGYQLDGTYVLRTGPWVEKNKKSNTWKTDKKTLRAIVEKTKCPFARAVLEYRAAHKAKSGFIHDIKLLSEYDGYLHTNFHLHGTSTGRLSSSDLNMQNLPGYLAGFNIKKIFLPDDPETEILVNIDYKGAEIRIFTAYARDNKLIEALNGGLDVHSLFVQEIYGIAYEIVAAHESLKETDKERYLDLKNKRTNCKRVVFGILYGAMAKKIAETAGISEEEAQKIIDGMFEKFPSIKNYMDETVAQIHQMGFVETLIGRRRRFPLQHVNGFFRGQAERRGKNMKIQSTSSDIVLGQLIEVDERIGDLGGRTCITVHDSIVATCKKKYASQLPAFIQKYCVDRVAEKYPWLPVAFAADVEVGPSYGEGMSIEKFLAKEREKAKTEEEMLEITFDVEAMDELREDEEEKAEREAVAAVVGSGT